MSILEKKYSRNVPENKYSKIGSKSVLGFIVESFFGYFSGIFLSDFSSDKMELFKKGISSTWWISRDHFPDKLVSVKFSEIIFIKINRDKQIEKNVSFTEQNSFLTKNGIFTKFMKF